MTSYWTPIIGGLAILVLAGCEGSGVDGGMKGTGTATDKSIGNPDSGASPGMSGEEAESGDRAENSAGGVIDSELGYPVQDERLGEHAGY